MFYHGVIPSNETAIVGPPLYNPEANPQEYWLLLKTLMVFGTYNKNNAIFMSIGLTPSLKDPCLYSGYIQDHLNLSGAKLEHPLSPCLYVDDFVYFSEDPEFKSLFCCLLDERYKVDFMGIVEWFLDVHFSRRITPTSVAVHINQYSLASNLV
jgi:hypothetical protein